jgi:hypothetical protein
VLKIYDLVIQKLIINAMEMKNMKLKLLLFKCGKEEQRMSINAVQPITNSMVQSLL